MPVEKDCGGTDRIITRWASGKAHRKAWRRIPERLVRLGCWCGGVDIFLRLALAGLEVGLAAVGSVDGAGAGLDLGLFRKIAPAGVTVFRALAVFVLLYGGLGTVLAADNLDHASGLIGADVVADDGVGKTGLVARRQRRPPCASKSQGLAERRAGHGTVCCHDYTPWLEFALGTEPAEGRRGARFCEEMSISRSCLRRTILSSTYQESGNWEREGRKLRLETLTLRGSAV